MIDRREGQINTYKPQYFAFVELRLDVVPFAENTMADESDIRREIGQVSDHVSYIML